MLRKRLSKSNERGSHFWFEESEPITLIFESEQTMGSVDDKGCYTTSTNSYNLAFNHRDRAAKKASHGRKAVATRAKPTPSKWDDAQKWLVGLSGVVDHPHHHHSKTKPRNSNAEDRRLLAPMPQKGRDSVSSMDGDTGVAVLAVSAVNQGEGETKKIDCSDLQYWRADNSVEVVAAGVRSVSLRDMGTEMTPNASKEPSRTGTPLRARSPSERESRAEDGSAPCSARGVVGKSSSLENRTLAWDEAERTKYMARYKREEVKIQAWENRKTRKAELQMKRIEVKAERMKTRAQEKLANKISSTRRRAEEKRTTAEAKLKERAAKTSERAEYVRSSGRMPSSFFSLKLPSLCR